MARATSVVIGNVVAPERAISVSGGEFTPSSTTPMQAFSNISVGTYGSDYRYEGIPVSIPNANRLTFDYLAARGWQTVKIPTRWERLQRTLSGALESTEVSRITTLLDKASAAGVDVVLDIHNYGLYYIDGTQTIPPQAAGTGYRFPIGSAEVTQSAFADLWSRIATQWGGHAAIIGAHIMNEPQPNGGLTRATWYSCAQAAVDAIRAVNTTWIIRVGGFQWSDTFNWTVNNPDGPWITDTTGLMWYETHHYWSQFNNGQYTSYSDALADAVTRGYTAGPNADALHTRILDELHGYTGWLSTHGVKGVIGEVSWPGNSATEQVLWNALGERYLDECDALGLNVDAWSCGEFYAAGSPDPLLIYNASGGGSTGVDTQRADATVWEAHLG